MKIEISTNLDSQIKRMIARMKPQYAEENAISIEAVLNGVSYYDIDLRVMGRSILSIAESCTDIGLHAEVEANHIAKRYGVSTEKESFAYQFDADPQ